MTACITTGRRAGYCPPGTTSGYLPVLPPAPPPPEFSDETLDHFLFFAIATDGIVIEPEVAKDLALPCRCTTITKSNGQTEDICFKRGVIGTLSQPQRKDLCRTTEPLRNPEGFQDRIKKFQRASDACVSQGANSLQSRIDCMSKWLRDNDPPLLRNARRLASVANSGDKTRK